MDERTAMDAAEGRRVWWTRSRDGSRGSRPRSDGGEQRLDMGVVQKNALTPNWQASFSGAAPGGGVAARGESRLMTHAVDLLLLCEACLGIVLGCAAAPWVTVPGMGER